MQLDWQTDSKGKPLQQAEHHAAAITAPLPSRAGCSLTCSWVVWPVDHHLRQVAEQLGGAQGAVALKIEQVPAHSSMAPM
jgi:hypothetical protein